jgi:hypothetical protein
MDVMEREDFQEITKKHIKVAKKIVKNNGCGDINCIICPFSRCNSVEGKICENGYDSVGKAKKFLELFDKPKEKSLNFYERLSATIFKKQILFKQDDGIYYNQRLHDTMTKSDVKEWLLAEVGELCKDE